MMDEAAMAARIGRKIKGLRGIPMSNQRVPVRGHFIRGSEQTIYRELSRKEERRQQSRYGLRARVDFRWKDRGKFYHHGEGFTRDISPIGMFVYADSHPPPKADIRVEVFFSPLAEGVSALQMSAKAHVLRVDPPTPGEPQAGFAAVGATFVLHKTKMDAKSRDRDRQNSKPRLFERGVTRGRC